MEQAIVTTETGVEKKRKGKTGKPKARKKIKKKWIVLGILIVAVAVVAIMCSSAAQSMMNNPLSYEDTSLIEQSDLTYSISATGTVVSTDTRNVYSTQAYTVQEVFVEVGDTIAEGDALCKLDSGMLEDQIEKMELSMGITAESAKQQVKAARDTYNAAKSALDEGLNSSLVSAQSQVDNTYNNWIKAQKAYNEYRDSINTGTNSQLLQLEASVNNAGIALQNARDAYNKAQSASQSAQSAWNSYKSGINTSNTAEISTLEYDIAATLIELTDLKAAYDTTEEAYNTALTAYNDGDPASNPALIANLENSQTAYNAATALYTQKQTRLADLQQQLATLKQQSKGTDAKEQQLYADYQTKLAAADTASNSYRQAQSSYDSALRQLNAAYSTSDNSLSDYSLAVDIAYQSYQTALESLAAAEKSADTQLQSSRNALKSTEIGANNDISVLELALMQEDLEETTITAPTSGTITAVYAKVGSSGSGLLFVIEDTKNLKVETTVKEYDIGAVTVGLPVTIRADALGDTVIDGKIQNISPASQKTAAGGIDTSGDVVFPTDVNVTGVDTGLRIGMSVRLNYIIEQKEDVLCVPYEAVFTNEEGRSCVLSVTDQGDGKHFIGVLPVITGMETDLSMEISGEGVSAGLRVINNPDSFLDLIGKSIPLAEHRVSTGGFSPVMMGR